MKVRIYDAEGNFIREELHNIHTEGNEFYDIKVDGSENSKKVLADPGQN